MSSIVKASMQSPSTNLSYVAPNFTYQAFHPYERTHQLHIWYFTPKFKFL